MVCSDCLRQSPEHFRAHHLNFQRFHEFLDSTQPLTHSEKTKQLLFLIQGQEQKLSSLAQNYDRNFATQLKRIESFYHKVEEVLIRIVKAYTRDCCKQVIHQYEKESNRNKEEVEDIWHYTSKILNFSEGKYWQGFPTAFENNYEANQKFNSTIKDILTFYEDFEIITENWLKKLEEIGEDPETQLRPNSTHLIETSKNLAKITEQKLKAVMLESRNETERMTNDPSWFENKTLNRNILQTIHLDNLNLTQEEKDMNNSSGLRGDSYGNGNDMQSKLFQQQSKYSRGPGGGGDSLKQSFPGFSMLKNPEMSPPIQKSKRKAGDSQNMSPQGQFRFPQGPPSRSRNQNPDTSIDVYYGGVMDNNGSFSPPQVRKLSALLRSQTKEETDKRQQLSQTNYKSGVYNYDMGTKTTPMAGTSNLIGQNPLLQYQASQRSIGINKKGKLQGKPTPIPTPYLTYPLRRRSSQRKGY